jgi:hypothetical protein
MINGRQEINDFRARVFGHDDDRMIAFICECSDSRCHRIVMLTRATYGELRRQGKPVLMPGHVSDEDAPLRAEREETAGADEGGPRSPEALEAGN